MRFLIIPDKFKGSLTSEEVYRAIKKGIQRVREDAHFHFIKASDGGDGFLDAVQEYRHCEEVKLETLDPLGRNIKSYYLYDGQQRTAYVELANSSGMELLLPEERNAALTTTFGTGQQIKNALERGAKKIYVGLGGSATNDGGMGIANALGYTFTDANGHLLEPIGKNLDNVHKIKGPDDLNMDGVHVYAINDVKNPLFGSEGAAHVYAAQKGADSQMIYELDAGLKNWNRVVEAHFGQDFSMLPGSGAAGGAGFGLKAFLNAEYVSGIDFILSLSGVKDVLQSEGFDCLITGEGKIDAQTLNGKLIQGVMDLAVAHNIPVIAVCGALQVDVDVLQSNGVKDVIEIQNPNKPLTYNMENAAALLEEKVATYFQKEG